MWYICAVKSLYAELSEFLPRWGRGLYSALNRRVVKATVLWNMECGEEAVCTPSS